MLRSISHPLAVQLLQQIRCMADLIIFTLACVSRGTPQPVTHVCFRHSFDVRSVSNRVLAKSVSVVFREGVAISEKPSLHQLNHPEHAIHSPWIDAVPLT